MFFDKYVKSLACKADDRILFIFDCFISDDDDDEDEDVDMTRLMVWQRLSLETVMMTV